MYWHTHFVYLQNKDLIFTLSSFLHFKPPAQPKTGSSFCVSKLRVLFGVLQSLQLPTCLVNPEDSVASFQFDCCSYSLNLSNEE